MDALIQEIETLLRDTHGVREEQLSIEQSIAIKRLGRLVLDATQILQELVLEPHIKSEWAPIGTLICRWWATHNTHLNSLQLQRLRLIARHILGPGEDPLGGPVAP